MQIASRIQSCIELLDTFFATKLPFDVIFAKFCKNNRWIGSADRREISQMMYDIFRCFEELRFYTRDITANFARAYVIAYLKQKKHMSLSIFSGQKYAPAPLSAFEERFAKKLEKEQLPQWARMNYPEWLEKSLKKAFPEDFENEIAALNQPANLVVRVNSLKASRDEVLAELSKLKIAAQPTEHAKYGIVLETHLPRDNHLLREGIIEIQDEGSQMIAKLCDPKDAKIVVDFCAGAGGKTLALAALMNNKGRLYAMDKYPKRIEIAQQRLKRAGVNNTTCFELSSKWIKRHEGTADIVLVDAPCSGTGTWRRNPDMRAKFSPNDLQEIVELQKSILENAMSLVKIGGKLAYATCSVLREENEEQIANFIKNHAEFSRTGNTLRLSPYTYGTDGFFADVLIKNDRCKV